MACLEERCLAPEQLSPCSPARREKEPTTDSGIARRLQEEFDHEVAEKEAKEKFQCKICFCDEKLENGVNLDCGHITCTDCFAAYLEVKIREKCVSEKEMCCPMPKCFCPVTDLQALGVLTPALKERFLDTRADLYRPDGLFERHCRCPCGQNIVVVCLLEEGFVECPSCKEEVCYKCQEKHRGYSCAAYWKWRNENDSAQQAFDELMASEGWKNCPSCKAPCSRASGCNFMSCRTEECKIKGGTHFCYQCGVQLKRADVPFHFKEYGPFSEFCKNKPDVFEI